MGQKDRRVDSKTARHCAPVVARLRRVANKDGGSREDGVGQGWFGEGYEREGKRSGCAARMQR